MPDIRSTFCRKLSYSTGTEDINPGTFLVFTMTYGKAGLSLTLQGSLNWTTIHETLWQLKHSLDKNETGPLNPLALFLVSNTSDMYDLQWRNKNYCVRLEPGPIRTHLTSWSSDALRSSLYSLLSVFWDRVLLRTTGLDLNDNYIWKLSKSLIS